MVIEPVTGGKAFGVQVSLREAQPRLWRHPPRPVTVNKPAPVRAQRRSASRPSARQAVQPTAPSPVRAKRRSALGTSAEQEVKS
jgi:hypothetical protein